jgi:hypothetical protein
MFAGLARLRELLDDSTQEGSWRPEFTSPCGQDVRDVDRPGGDIELANRAGLFPGRDGAEIEGLDGIVRNGDVAP